MTVCFMNESINWLALLFSEYSNEAKESGICLELRAASKATRTNNTSSKQRFIPVYPLFHLLTQ